jgi:TolB protein
MKVASLPVAIVLAGIVGTAHSAENILEYDRVVDPSGCQLERFAAEPGISQYQYDSFSADGRLIAIAWDRGEESRGTYLLNIETGKRTDIPALNNGATFSPDGKYLLNSVYVENGKTDIALYELASGESTFLAVDDAWEWLPSYSPDGSSIVFNSFRSGNSDLYLLDLETMELRQLTDAMSYDAHAQFSPDGQSVLYHEQTSKTDFNIKRIDLADGRVQELGKEAGEESYASWSPDGKFIAYASDRNQEPGVADIFIMNNVGETIRTVTNFPAKDGYPFWSPDGKYLYFTSYREPQGVYRVRMSNLIDCEEVA